jgi:hypothetical protein
MTISATSQGLRPGVCLSTSRPSTPFDGMMIYETDTNLVRIWNGTAWKTLAYSDYTSGSVLQVVSTTKTDTFTTTSATYVDVTGLSVSITPSSATSKVLILATLSIGSDSANNSHRGRLVRDSTAIAVGDASSSRTQASFGSVTPDNAQSSNVVHFLDSPSTTSATVYKIQVSTAVSGQNIGVNRSDTDPDSSVQVRTSSSITAMEIAG